MIHRMGTPVDIEILKTMAEGFKSSSERGEVLVVASILEDLLRQCIEAHVVAHRDIKQLTNGSTAPVGTFFSRILVSFAIGLIPEDEYTELNLIRKIRNEFAHHTNATFQSQSVAKRCASLLSWPPFQSIQATNQQRYTLSAAFLMLVLSSRLPQISKQRLSFTEETAFSNATKYLGQLHVDPK